MDGYIYIITYYNEIIAAADDDKKADEVIKQYMRHNKNMTIDMFDKVPIRFFKEDSNEV